MQLSDLTAMIDQLAQDDAAQLQPDDRDRALKAAVERYSQDRPRRLVVDLPISNRDLNLPDDWELEFSVALNLEYPIGQRPPANVPNEGWYLYQSPIGERIEFADGYGGAGSARLTYTRRHLYDAGDDTCSIPDQHLEAVASWGAAVLCEQLAAYYSANTGSTISADTVDHTSPAKQYAIRAATLRKRYFDELGIDPKRNVAAGAVVTPVKKNSTGGARLTHPLWTTRKS